MRRRRQAAGRHLLPARFNRRASRLRGLVFFPADVSGRLHCADLVLRTRRMQDLFWRRTVTTTCGGYLREVDPPSEETDSARQIPPAVAQHNIDSDVPNVVSREVLEHWQLHFYL